MTPVTIAGTVARVMVWRHSWIANGPELLFVQSRRLLSEKTWEIPGGKVKWSESPNAAAVRELEEETNLQLSEAAKLVDWKRETPFNTHWRYVVFEANRYTGLARITRPNEIKDLRWFSLTHLPPLDEHTATLFKKFGTKLRLTRTSV